MTGRPVSVVLAACNGSEHIGEQLDTIAAQTVPPDEIVVVDDASDDDTVAVVEQFAVRSRVPVRLHLSAERLGVVGNVERGLRLAAGDLLVLADQDDVWRPDKLQVLLACFDDPQVLAAFSDASLLGASGTLWEAHRVPRPPTAPALLDRLLQGNVVTGATMALRRSLLARALPLPTGAAHDHWLALLAAQDGALVAVPQQLMTYRLHANNLVGIRGAGLAARLRAAPSAAGQLDQRRELLELLVSRRGEVSPEVQAELDYVRRRQALPLSRLPRARGVLRLLRDGTYRTHGRGPLTALADLAARRA